MFEKHLGYKAGVHRRCPSPSSRTLCYHLDFCTGTVKCCQSRVDAFHIWCAGGIVPKDEKPGELDPTD